MEKEFVLALSSLSYKFSVLVRGVLRFLLAHACSYSTSTALYMLAPASVNMSSKHEEVTNRTSAVDQDS